MTYHYAYLGGYMQQLSILSVYHVPSLEKLYIKVVNVDGPRYVLTFTMHKENASIFNQDQVKDLLEDFRSHNQDQAYFADESIHTEMKQGLIEVHNESL
jgi:hypothetical protein